MTSIQIVHDHENVLGKREWTVLKKMSDSAQQQDMEEEEDFVD